MDGNRLDSTRENLRILSRSNNLRNRTIKHRGGESCSSRFPGVYWEKRYKKWRAQIVLENGKRRKLGWFADEKKAARVYMEALQKINPEIFRPEWKELQQPQPI